eukprot:UN07601
MNAKLNGKKNLRLFFLFCFIFVLSYCSCLFFLRTC